jgi:hypothetical protein
MIDHDGDRQVLKALAGHGSDLSKPHHIVQWFYFPSRRVAQAVSARLEREGLGVQEVKPAPASWWKRLFGQASWTCVVETHMVPNEEAIFRNTDRFNALAREFGGEYDGWEAGVKS